MYTKSTKCQSPRQTIVGTFIICLLVLAHKQVALSMPVSSELESTTIPGRDQQGGQLRPSEVDKNSLKNSQNYVSDDVQLSEPLAMPGPDNKEPAGLNGPKNGGSGAEQASSRRDGDQGNGQHLSDKEEEEEKECPICRDEFSGEANSFRLHCNHLFHRECIRSWLSYVRPEINQKCPVCREEASFAEVRRLLLKLP